ncbi:MAG: class I SAM-dependent methyltransferase [Gammaproteobacteria bacterium]|nr:class I SAM-dependent methyltransferase [Gammaproteobacteria bacterium]
MDSAIYPLMREIEDRHWWFVVRRRIIGDMLDKIEFPDGARILDAGCGTGGNLELLSHYGVPTGLEMDETAANLARARNVANIAGGSFPDNLQFPKDSFNLVTFIDVLEHIEDDLGALLAARSILVAGGSLLITVPAFQFLWGTHDEMHHHKRRYRKERLADLITRSGFRLQYISYFNTFLFPMAVIARMAEKYIPFLGGQAGSNLPGPRVNSVLAAIFNCERKLLGRMRLPFGVSIIAIARKD